MIRERRNKEKLAQYYQRFIEEGVLDPNVHPWVAESWKRCLARGLAHEKMSPLVQLSREELALRRKRHEPALNFMDGVYEQCREHLNMHNLSMLLIDEESYVLKNYALPFFQKTLDDVQGARVSERDIGTSSISVAKEHKVPFLLFGPEMWIKECQTGDACSAPVIVEGRVRYIISVFSIDQPDLPYEGVIALLMSIRFSLEQYLTIFERLRAAHVLLDALPMAVYHVKPGGRVTYANQYGKKRLDNHTDLSEIFLNYEHIPINRGFQGIPSYNKEVTWIAHDKAYEDITTVVPVRNDDDVTSVIAISTAIEDLKTTVAHATSYSARYSLLSMVGEAEDFVALQNKAARVARGDANVLLQGEPGTGKQRLAHGIHQASPRAAGALISIKCGNISEDALEAELFGYGEGASRVAGKVELAKSGTLFIDEIEKMPVALGDKLASVLSGGQPLPEEGEAEESRGKNVRVIAACDSNLKRLADKGLFSMALYEALSRITLRVPSLRNRVEDIELVANHIVSEIAAQHSLPPKRLSADALAVLKSFSWPGNIKQLQAVLEMAFFHTQGLIIGAEQVKLPGDRTLGKSWKYDRDAFIEVWKAAGGNISRLASMLDVSRVTLYRYLKKYDLGKKEEA